MQFGKRNDFKMVITAKFCNKMDRIGNVENIYFEAYYTQVQGKVGKIDFERSFREK